MTFLDGYCLHTPEPKHCAAVGEALARLHLAGADFPLFRANTLSVDGWSALFEPWSARADEVAPGLRDMIAEELQFLPTHWPQGLAAGVVHADLFPDNVLFLDDELSGLIDFYFACNDLFAYDLAITFNAWCFDANFSYDREKGRALIEGYARIRALSAAEYAAFQTLAPLPRCASCSRVSSMRSMCRKALWCVPRTLASIWPN